MLKISLFSWDIFSLSIPIFGGPTTPAIGGSPADRQTHQMTLKALETSDTPATKARSHRASRPHSPPEKLVARRANLFYPHKCRNLRSSRVPSI